MEILFNERVFRSKIKNYRKLNKIILDKIDSAPSKSYYNNDSETLVSNTDWEIENDKSEFFKEFLGASVNHLKEICIHHNLDKCNIGRIWYQQYYEGSSHGWHNHPNCHFANVYFVECPKGSSTKFKDFDLDCSVGEIISFPSYLIHNSPLLQKNKRKTVIAFNTNISIQGQ